MRIWFPGYAFLALYNTETHINCTSSSVRVQCQLQIIVFLPHQLQHSLRHRNVVHTKLLLFFFSSGYTTVAWLCWAWRRTTTFHHNKAASSSTLHSTTNIHPIKGRWGWRTNPWLMTVICVLFIHIYIQGEARTTLCAGIIIIAQHMLVVTQRRNHCNVLRSQSASWVRSWRRREGCHWLRNSTINNNNNENVGN